MNIDLEIETQTYNRDVPRLFQADEVINEDSKTI